MQSLRGARPQRCARMEHRPLYETHFGGADGENLPVEEFFDDEEEAERKGGCDSCMTRMPYATLIATIMCVLGVVVFCVTMHRGATLALLMFDQVFNIRMFWIEAVQMAFVIVGACMGALGFMILFVGCLTTGATRYRVYKAWGSRIGGRISCAVFMVITYILQFAWIFMFIFLVVVTFLFTTFWFMCNNEDFASGKICGDLTQFDFYFPKGHKQEHMKICGAQNVKLFCKDYVEKAEIMFILATVSCILIILSLVHYLMCLAANYAHIRDHEKMQELQDLHYLQEPELSHKESRF